VQAQYPLENYSSPYAALSEAFGDGVIACPTITAANLLASLVPVYLYQFDYPNAAFFVPIPAVLGAYHGAEIQFVFQQPVSPFTPPEAQLADQMLGYWTRFAASGNPNGQGAATWPLLDSAQRHLVLDTPIGEAANAKAAVCPFWQGLHVESPLGP
jgi:para-nitrobenzyl esterase